jgi:large subunit ribosomal protein L25
MKTLDLKGTIRTDLGKKATKKVRLEERIPCIIYGINQPIHFEADAKEFGHLVYTPHVYLANLDLDGTAHQAVVKEIQFHPVTDKILHIDFIEVIPKNLSLWLSLFNLKDSLKVFSKVVSWLCK